MKIKLSMSRYLLPKREKEKLRFLLKKHKVAPKALMQLIKFLTLYLLTSLNFSWEEFFSRINERSNV